MSEQKPELAENAIPYLKKVINVSGIILILFLIIFVISLSLSQFIRKDYTNTLRPLDTLTLYQQINNTSFESQGQLVANLFALNSNTQTIQQYLNKDIVKQFDSISNNISALNNQISTLYTLFNNSFIIFTIILGIFTLIIAVLGFYISKVIEARYELIKESKNEVEILKKSINELISGKSRELFNKIQEHDTENLLNSLKDNPHNISNIITTLNTRKITGDKYWHIIKSAYLSLVEIYPYDWGNLSISATLSLMFQFYPDKIVNEQDQELKLALKQKLFWLNQISFFPNEFARLIKEFQVTKDKELILLLDNLVFKNQTYSFSITKDMYSKELRESLQDACKNNPEIKKLVTDRNDYINKQYNVLMKQKTPNNEHLLKTYEKEIEVYTSILTL